MILNFVIMRSFEKLNLDCATGRLMKEPTGGSALIPSPRRGRTKVGVISLIGSRAPLSRPFPIKGKGGPSKIETICPHFSSPVGERKIMNHFVVKSTVGSPS